MLPLLLAAALTQVPAEPCDPSKTPCLRYSIYMLGLKLWTPDNTEPSQIVGPRGEAELQYPNGLRIQGRIDGTATAGEYEAGNLLSVRDVEGHLAVAYDLVHLPQQVTAGPMVAVGAAVGISHGKAGVRASIPRAVTAVLGLRIGWTGGWVEGGVGAVQEWPRGVGLKVTWSLSKGSANIAQVGTISYGRRKISPTPPVTDIEGTELKPGVPGGSGDGWCAWLGIAMKVPRPF